MTICLKSIRETKNITQEDVAKHIGVSQQFVSRLENNTKALPLAMAVEIADYLDVSLDELVGRERKKEQEEQK